MAITKDNTVLQTVISVVESTLRLPSGKLEADANFEDIGMDSIISMELIRNISRNFSISMSPSKLTNVSTVRELADLVEKDLNGQNIDKSKSNDLTIEGVRDNVSPEKQVATQPALARTRQTPAIPTSRRGRGGEESFQKLLEYVNQKYDVDLSNRSFNSVDEIVNALVVSHAGKLVPHLETFEQTDKLNGKTLHFKENNIHSGKEVEHQISKVQDIAIVGVSCNFPDAPNAQIFWENLINQKSSIREIPKTRWNWEDFYAESVAPGKTVSKWGALINAVDVFDAKFFNISSEEAMLMDPQERVLMQEVYKAFQDGGIDPSKLRGTRTGVFVSYEYSE